MANKYNTSTPTKIQTMLTAVTAALGGASNNAEMDFKDSVGCSITITVAPDGQSVVLTGHPSDRGQSNPFGTAVTVSGTSRNPRVSPVRIPVTSLPLDQKE